MVSLPRRKFLRGVLGGAATVGIGLPLLDIMLNDNGTALADGSELPKRFGVFYWGGGIVHSAWVPSSTGTGWTLPRTLEPFGDLREYTSLITGTNHSNSSPGHIPARGLALSSSHDMDRSIEGVGTYRGQRHPEPSIDALVAEAWSGATAYDLLTVGICRKGPYKSNSSWGRGGSAYNRHEASPQALFDRIFSGPIEGPSEPSDTGLLEATNAFERSMLDAVMDDVPQLNGRLGARDRARLEQHLEGLRALERRIMEIGIPGSDSCLAPDRPVTTDFGDGSANEQKEAKAQLFSQVLAHAMACDLTRVFSFEWSATQSEAVYWEVGISQEHHQYNHDNKQGEGMIQITQFIMQNFAYLAQTLKDMPEGDGNLLDNTLVLGTSEHANAGNHNYSDHPYLFVGGAGMAGGVHHRREGSNNDAPRCLLTAAHSVGVMLPSIGQGDSDGPRVATEPFTEIMS